MITRDLEWLPTGAMEPRTIRVGISLPEPHPELGGYQCTLTVEGFDELIEGFSERRSGTFHDTEGMLALTDALNSVPHVIEYLSERLEGGRIASNLRNREDLHLLEAERELEYLAPGASTAVPVKVVISPPFQDDDTWFCTLGIRGLGEDHVRTVQHADTIGAITEALHLAPAALRELTPPGGRLTYHGSEDLGFPVRAGR